MECHACHAELGKLTKEPDSGRWYRECSNERCAARWEFINPQLSDMLAVPLRPPKGTPTE